MGLVLCLLWCAVVWCILDWFRVVWYSVLWGCLMQFNMVWCGLVRCGGVWYGVVPWCGMLQCGLVWCSLLWFAMVVSSGMVWCNVGWYCLVWWFGAMWCDGSKTLQTSPEVCYGLMWCSVACSCSERQSESDLRAGSHGIARQSMSPDMAWTYMIWRWCMDRYISLVFLVCPFTAWHCIAWWTLWHRMTMTIQGKATLSRNRDLTCNGKAR